MSNWLVTNEVALRLAVFTGILAICLLMERWIPKKNVKRRQSVRRRLNNLSMPVAAGLLARLAAPLLPIIVAGWATKEGLGLFNMLELPLLIAAAACIVFLDLAIYWQHRLMHRVPSLWRLHRMHHSDMILDVTTGVRFHPLEFLLSLLFKSAIIVVLGAPVIAVLLFELLLNATALFNHSNIGFSALVDKRLRWFLVTPDMHRIHHSTRPLETNSNFGFSVPYWDYLFKTYTQSPSEPLDSMKVGLANYRSDEEQTLLSLLRQPLDP